MKFGMAANLICVNMGILWVCLRLRWPRMASRRVCARVRLFVLLGASFGSPPLFKNNTNAIMTIRNFNQLHLFLEHISEHVRRLCLE